MSQEQATAPVTEAPLPAIAARFRGFLPVIIDVETGGFNCATDALLEIAAVFVRFNATGDLEPADQHRVLPACEGVERLAIRHADRDP